MDVGLYLTNQQYLDTDMVAALEEQYAMARAARDWGWDSLFSGQNYLNEGNNKQLQLVPFVARLMAEAGHMTTGLGILVLPLHNPVYVAETVASLDVIAKGNFVFGVGLGYRETEFDAFRVPRGQRVARFEEILALVKRLWSGERVTHDSEVCKLDGVAMNIRPVQKPHPPIWIAANNEKAIRRAARLGDTWMVNSRTPLSTLKERMAAFRNELETLGKPFPAELPVIRELYCARDRKTALEKAGPWLLGKDGDARWGQDKVMPGSDAFGEEIEELVRDRFILGSPEECYEELRPYWEELGMNHLIIRTHWVGMPAADAMDSMRLITDELLPALHKV